MSDEMIKTNHRSIKKKLKLKQKMLNHELISLNIIICENKFQGFFFLET